jgi:hypothetical protein
MNMVMEESKIELAVSEHNIVVDIIALVVQPAKVYNHILHKTLHYLDSEGHIRQYFMIFIFILIFI